MGAQTAGKTKMIISLVFHHLIDNEYFDRNMGEQVLKIFQTGRSMVTRRPTTVELSCSNENNDDKGNKCILRISLNGETAEYGDGDNFEMMVNRLCAESSDEERRVYNEEVKLIVCAKGLPNITFTDLPGLVNTSYLSYVVRRLVNSYVIRKDTTIVVVESALTEDYDTSLPITLLRYYFHY
jgi:hypothetical protein